MNEQAPRINVSMTVEQLWQDVPGGSGTYIKELAAQLVGRADVAPTGIRARGAAGDMKGLPPTLPVLASRLPRPALYEAWSRLRRPSVPSNGPVDVVHATTWAIPPRSAPLVVTVHDLAFERSPQHFTPRGVRFFERALEITRDEADVVVVPSRATMLDCVEAGIEKDRIHVVPHGTSAADVTDAAAADFRARHGLARDFVLWCGTLEPRKNVGRLLAAFERSVDDHDLDLVLIGPTGWGSTSSEVRTALTNLPSGRVHVLGHVTWDDLQVAYSVARVFCFPSLWEGFGMPVLEAQAHGTPVVTSAGTSMAEVVGDGALLVDPLDTDAIAHALTLAAGPQHDELASAALRNAEAYTWRRAADLTVQAYRDALGVTA
ncbi:glycosyltransferase family 4 protein [Oerskovia paurometabola]|uniref:glycosyltransferase family 4 protein n=1 Tax=Oerskovia paurometabola TaxID=162170 RepID=UPI00381A20F9